METKIKELKFKDFIWIDICKPDQKKLDKIAEEYKLNYLQIKDSLEAGHLPKLEKHEKYNFLILRAFTANLADKATTVNELSNKIAFFYTNERIITIHRADFDFLKNIHKEFLNLEDFLVYVLQMMLETYTTPLNVLSNKNDEMEKIIFLKDHTKISLEDLYFQKTQTRITKKLLQIIQNIVHEIEVNESAKVALQDVKDSLLNLVLSYEEIFENSNNLLNTYISINAQKSNDVVKLLTVFSAFFLPLTFIVGIYGMNFENMPELKWNMGYFLALGLMLLVSAVIFYWFKRRKIL